jgi:predicted RNase H-like nuclease (RuvC/YqgF family)
MALFGLAAALQGQDTDTNGNASPSPGATAAAAMAAKQGADERYERVAADVQALQAANEDLQNKITGLEEEIRKLREEEAQQGDVATVRDDVKHLADKIEEVDRKRADDKAAITEEVRTSIAGLEKALATGGSPPARAATPRPAANTEPPANVENGFVYTVQTGDSLSAIIKAYNTDFKSKGLKVITIRQAREANPNVDWNRLRVGQKIVIPRPAE